MKREARLVEAVSVEYDLGGQLAVVKYALPNDMPVLYAWPGTVVHFVARGLEQAPYRSNHKARSLRPDFVDDDKHRLVGVEAVECRQMRDLFVTIMHFPGGTPSIAYGLPPPVAGSLREQLLEVRSKVVDLLAEPPPPGTSTY